MDNRHNRPTRPLLAVIDSRSTGDGVAYVGALLRTALSQSYDDLAVVGLDAGRGGRVRVADQARFVARLAWSQFMHQRDWVLFNHLGLARAQRRLPPVIRRPYGVFLHGVEIWGTRIDDELRETLREAALLLSNSEFTARRTMELYPDIGPVVSCPLALLPPGREDANAAADGSITERVGSSAVVIIGRMAATERYKGHDTLVDCWPAVVAAVPEAQLVIVGTGNDTERLRAKAAAAGVGPSVLFTGFVSSATKRAILDRAVALAMPSKGEGFGLVYLEAMRAGIPCIGSTADAAGDVISDGESGLLVPPDDPAALATAVVRLLRDRQLASRLGAGGRLLEAEVYSFGRFRDRLRKAIEERILPRMHVTS